MEGQINTNLKYSVIKKDSETEAKISSLENLSLSKVGLFPSGFLAISSYEDARVILDLFRTQSLRPGMFSNIAGVSVKLHKLRSLGPILHQAMPQNGVFLTDISLDALYFGNLKDDKKEFYSNYNLLPDKMKTKVSDIQKIKKFGEKSRAHTSMWEETIKDRKELLRLITNTTNIQMTYNSDTISTPGPILINSEDIGLAETIYETARKLYLGGTVDIERDNGRLLLLDLTLHKNLLYDKNKVKELIRTVSRIKPRGLKLKIADIFDLRNETRQTIFNWKLLVKSLGAMSFSEGFPTFYSSANADGLIAQIYGIDGFIQTFNRNDVDRNFKLSAETIKKQWEINPNLTSGRISQYASKEFITRGDFENILFKSGWPYPMTDIPSQDYQTVKTMTPQRFRIFSKEVLISQRNFEINELKNAIKNGEGTRLLKNKFGQWIKDLDIIF